MRLNVLDCISGNSTRYQRDLWHSLFTQYCNHYGFTDWLTIWEIIHVLPYIANYLRGQGWYVYHYIVPGDTHGEFNWSKEMFNTEHGLIFAPYCPMLPVYNLMHGW